MKARKPTLEMKKGTVYVQQVFHDLWCKSNTTKSRKPELCNCNPDFKLVETDNSPEHVSAALGIKPENE